ncbi:hypothetical protein RRG08_026299 [Elysia crispata]|uniref:Uncharacterized protein n=1 Tax=Elysia crispata TaxID=231223 RepID=A0AAE0ZBG0_9GAST|nr:hypothetical protein RRG08_026299 [Elysia crispata]
MQVTQKGRLTSVSVKTKPSALDPLGKKNDTKSKRKVFGQEDMDREDIDLLPDVAAAEKIINPAVYEAGAFQER